jgi:hypothetical protein
MRRRNQLFCVHHENIYASRKLHLLHSCLTTSFFIAALPQASSSFRNVSEGDPDSRMQFYVRTFFCSGHFQMRRTNNPQETNSLLTLIDNDA